MTEAMSGDVLMAKVPVAGKKIFGCIRPAVETSRRANSSQEESMRTMTLAVAGIALAVMAAAAAAQATYPNKTIRMIVPFPAGGPTDIIARTVAQKLTESMGQPVVIDNRGGSGGNIGTDIVAKATPDGYTLLMAIVSHAINPTLYSKLPYDPIKDFSPITKTGAATIILSAHPSVPVKSIKDLIALAKAKPGQLNFGSPGSGTPHHLAGELLKTMAGIDLIHVPTKALPRRSRTCWADRSTPRS